MSSPCIGLWCKTQQPSDSSFIMLYPSDDQETTFDLDYRCLRHNSQMIHHSSCLSFRWLWSLFIWSILALKLYSLWRRRELRLSEAIMASWCVIKSEWLMNTEENQAARYQSFISQISIPHQATQSFQCCFQGTWWTISN